MIAKLLRTFFSSPKYLGKNNFRTQDCNDKASCNVCAYHFPFIMIVCRQSHRYLSAEPTKDMNFIRGHTSETQDDDNGLTFFCLVFDQLFCVSDGDGLIDSFISSNNLLRPCLFPLFKLPRKKHLSLSLCFWIIELSCRDMRRQNGTNTHPNTNIL